jgi:hypothetical protein
MAGLCVRCRGVLDLPYGSGSKAVEAGIKHNIYLVGWKLRSGSLEEQEVFMLLCDCTCRACRWDRSASSLLR